jgi:hypothetical protein
MTDISGPARLTVNPKLKPVGQGDEKQFVCELRVRFTNFKRKKNSEDFDDNGFWADVNIWGPFAEPSAEFFEKGDKVFIIGNLDERHWIDSDNPDIEHGRLQVNSSFVAPWTPDLVELRYKPRQSQLSPADDSGTSVIPSIDSPVEDLADVS